MVFSCVYVIVKNKNTTSSKAGTITVIVNNINDEVVEKRRIEYKEDDTLFEVLNNSYTLVYSQTTYGHFLLGISNDTFKIETNGKSSWIWLEVAYLKDTLSYSDTIDFNDYEKQNVTTGIDGISLKDNMIIALNERDNQHNTSMFNDQVVFYNTSILDTVFHIIVYVVSGLFVLGIIIFLIINRKGKNPITIPELCILAFMTVLLFVQEELFSFIPNFQFTFLLLAVYVVVFGYKKTSLIILAHVLLDNMFMGSLTPIVMIPMWMGYMIYTGVIWLFKDQKLWILVLGGALSAYLYCMLFLVTNAIFLDINLYVYWISDIPFEVMLVSCTSFTLIYLYKPLSKKLGELWRHENPLDVSDTIDNQDNGEI
ncbi:hypothetical protein EI71_01035 [Anaeroplasma bactoclasticum]|jgi:hypothetical protein|uniref:Uncharacterized protein n=1 Tax=Anaeroplasma bactoclasticum TaxID=2088 RepID=A0A397RRR9_9MOLU|nr:hypothetical protein [Anaeroplasma bactoclasticum]RIA75862.1 hypothetical protein EI71_01035 [Anaeroplasma bactoclasticum]